MMNKILHISDLHFGTEQNYLVDSLINEISQIQPDIIVVSGDLTQRAYPSQYQSFNLFLNKIKNKSHVICIPGNHDIPLHDLIKRFFIPFRNYNKFVTSEMFPTYYHHNLAIIGLNSVARFKPMGGYISDRQLSHVVNFFKITTTATNRVVIMHHNLIRSERHKTLNNAEKIINVFAECKVNLVLSGHIHSAHIELLKRDYLSHLMYVITAGTAISTRTIEPNSFNIIELDQDCFRLVVKELDQGTFRTKRDNSFPLIVKK